jgi:hypothetical protein
MWTTIQLTLGLLGLLFAFTGDKLSLPILFYIGIGCFGLTSMAVGWEAILTRRIVLGRRRHANQETYTDIPAMFQGMQFNLFGLFLTTLAILIYFNNGREAFLQMVRHPGLPLMLFGALCLMQAAISIVGPHESKEGPRWITILNLLVLRLLPGLILIGIGLIAVGLGFFEVIAPTAFDQMGGGFLEALYGLR